MNSSCELISCCARVSNVAAMSNLYPIRQPVLRRCTWYTLLYCEVQVEPNVDDDVAQRHATQRHDSSCRALQELQFVWLQYIDPSVLSPTPRATTCPPAIYKCSLAIYSLYKSSFICVLCWSVILSYQPIGRNHHHHCIGKTNISDNDNNNSNNEIP